MPTNERDTARSVVILLDRLRTGGTEKQSVWLNRALRECGWQSRLHLLYPDLEESVTQLSGAEYVSLAGPVVRLLREFRKNCPEILICMGRTANSLGFLVKRCFPSVRLVTTCRTNRPLPLWYRLSLRQSQLCIANSRWAADEAVRVCKVPPSRVVHIENALLRPELFQLDPSPAAKAAARRGLGLAATASVLCNISSFVPGKNKIELLEAFVGSGLGAEAVLLLVGEGSERSECQQHAEALGITAQVRFFGRTDCIEPILQASDVFVSTSLRDSLPNALVEAQAAALPVVAYDVAGAAEAFEHEGSGIAVRRSDIVGFSQAIGRLVKSPDLMRAWGANGRQRALQLYDPPVIRERYNAGLDGLIC